MIGRRRPDPEQPPFIVRKIRSRRAKHPHGAWKVAYADFVTSMMALFIVLWAAEQSPVIRSSIATYFRNPSALPAGREQSDRKSTRLNSSHSRASRMPSSA